MKVGYIRVSSMDQRSDRQLQGISVDRTYVDKCSGKSMERPELQKMLSFVREGDVVVVHSLDRLARNLTDLLRLVEVLTQKGVCIEFIKEHLSFGVGEYASPTARLMLSVVGAFAEFERSMIKERQLEGIALAKRRGAYKGRKRSVTEEQIEILRTLLNSGVPMTKAAKKVGISRASAYRYLNGIEGNE